ncbi:hypothetical protein EZV61_02215 [Corallincola luteus]|uniref:Uncharacterized protein n=1 Tax=Corallincola luteus TaxID=1775177 RepID=A0ABY2AQE4_9GAMM|nr:hypothetical protein [Corallincola luteus]TCI04808.1 hypothetical protein EZV61_02215 [Corallincola luteus]
MMRNKPLSPTAKSTPQGLTLKQITQQKYKATWGDVPPLFQKIASAAADLDGMFKQGFDHALKHILNRRHWNSELLTDPATRQLHKPRLAVYQLFTDWGFEVHCFPYLGDNEIDEYQRLNPKMEFSLWDPANMRRLIHVRHLKEFIEYAHRTGDRNDKALLAFTNAAVNRVMRHLSEQVRITKVGGLSIPKYLKLVVEQKGDYLLDDLPPHVSKRLGSDTLYLLRQAEKRKVREQQQAQIEQADGSEAPVSTETTEETENPANDNDIS